MLCLIPIAASDATVLPGFLKALSHFGPYPNDTCLIVVTPEVEESRPEMMEMVHKIKGLFSNSASDCVKITPNTPEGGWPLAPNIHFMYCIDELSKLNNRDPFIYLETDATPVTHDWLSQLKQEYAYAEKPYMGVWAKTYELIQSMSKADDPKDRKPVGEPFLIQNDHHMVGMGIYPPDYIHRSGPQAKGSPVWNTNTLWKYPDGKKPFDIFCQNYHRPCHDTKLIKHLWHTIDYGVTPDGDVICKDLEEPKEYLLKDSASSTYGKPLVLKNGGIINLKGVALVHGCKDGSLADLVVGGYLEQSAPLSTEVKVDDAALKAALSENEQMKKRLADMEAKMDRILNSTQQSQTPSALQFEPGFTLPPVSKEEQEDEITEPVVPSAESPAKPAYVPRFVTPIKSPTQQKRGPGRPPKKLQLAVD